MSIISVNVTSPPFFFAVTNDGSGDAKGVSMARGLGVNTKGPVLSTVARYDRSITQLSKPLSDGSLNIRSNPRHNVQPRTFDGIFEEHSVKRGKGIVAIVEVGACWSNI